EGVAAHHGIALCLVGQQQQVLAPEVAQVVDVLYRGREQAVEPLGLQHLPRPLLVQQRRILRSVEPHHFLQSYVRDATQAGLSSRRGNRRTRMRPCSMTTTLPCSNACSIAGRFASSSSTCLRGWRSVLRRKMITDGLCLPLIASRVPKSVSADTT